MSILRMLFRYIRYRYITLTPLSQIVMIVLIPMTIVYKAVSMRGDQCGNLLDDVESVR